MRIGYEHAGAIARQRSDAAPPQPKEPHRSQTLEGVLPVVGALLPVVRHAPRSLLARHGVLTGARISAREGLAPSRGLEVQLIGDNPVFQGLDVSVPPAGGTIGEVVNDFR